MWLCSQMIKTRPSWLQSTHWYRCCVVLCYRDYAVALDPLLKSDLRSSIVSMATAVLPATPKIDRVSTSAPICKRNLVFQAVAWYQFLAKMYDSAPVVPIAYRTWLVVWVTYQRVCRRMSHYRANTACAFDTCAAVKVGTEGLQ